MQVDQKTAKVLAKAQKLSNSNKNKQALLLLNKIKPDWANNYQVLLLKARCLSGDGRIKESTRILSQLLKENSSDINLLINLALNFNLQQDYSVAIGYAKQAVKLEPHNFGLLLNLASSYRANCNTASAISILYRALQMSPREPQALLLLSELLIEQGDYQDALVNLSDLTDSTAKLMLLLDCYTKLNWFAKAYATIQNINRTIDRQDDYFKALYITRLVQVDEKEKARELLGDKPPSKAPSLLYHYLQLKEVSAQQLDDLTAKVFQADYGATDKQSLIYALSEKHSKATNHQRSFELLTQIAGPENSVEAQQSSEEFFAKIKATYSSYSQKKNSASQSRLPIFVIGMPRSGTTLVENILATHSRVFGAGETSFIESCINGKPDALHTHEHSIRYLQSISTWKDDEYRKIANQYLKSLKQHSREAIHIVDKMPHNFLHLGIIRQVFPLAKIIHCVRNPVANCLSIYKQHFGSFHWYANNLNVLPNYYRSYLDLMQFWKDNIRELNLIEVSYEKLVTDFEANVKKLLLDCELEFEENCLLFYQQKRAVNTLSSRQVRKQIYQTSLKPWLGVESYIQPLIDAFPGAID